jgi:cobalt transporter subunit CbtA
MLFRQIVFYALFAGVLSGLALTVVQRWQVVPIILSAEEFENQSAQMVPAMASPDDHTHSADEWAPDDGLERTLFTLLANMLTAIGFALVLMSAMVASRSIPGNENTRFGWQRGLLWGIAGYAVFWLAPAIGMPPEIPLQTAAPLELRQMWWVFAVVCTAAGLGGLAFAKSPARWIAPVLLIIPHIVGAPHPEGHMFGDQPPAVAAQLEELAQQFIGATAIANAVLWVVIGLVAGWSVQRIIASMKSVADEETETEAPSV